MVKMANLDRILRTGGLSRRELLELAGKGALVLGANHALSGLVNAGEQAKPRRRKKRDNDGGLQFYNVSAEELADMNNESDAIDTAFASSAPWILYDGETPRANIRDSPNMGEFSLAHEGNSEVDQKHLEETLANESYSMFGVVPSAAGSPNQTFIRTYLTPERDSGGNKVYVSGLKVVAKFKDSKTGQSKKVKGVTAGAFGEVFAPADAFSFAPDEVTIKVRRKKSKKTSKVTYKFKLGPGTNYVQFGIPQSEIPHPHAGESEILDAMGLPANKKIITASELLEFLGPAIWAREEGLGNILDNNGKSKIFGNSRFATNEDNYSKTFNKQNKPKTYKLVLDNNFNESFYEKQMPILAKVLTAGKFKFKKNIDWESFDYIEDFTKNGVPEGYVIGQMDPGVATYRVFRGEDDMRIKSFGFVLSEPGPVNNGNDPLLVERLYRRLLYSECNLGHASEPYSEKEGLKWIKKWPIPMSANDVDKMLPYFNAVGWKFPLVEDISARVLYDSPQGAGANLKLKCPSHDLI